MNFKVIASAVITLCVSMPSMASVELSKRQVLVECNKSASKLVDSYESELKSLKESRRLDLISLVSEGCQGGYESASEGKQYKDIERYLTSTSQGSELTMGLMLDSVQQGFKLYGDSSVHGE